MKKEAFGAVQNISKTQTSESSSCSPLSSTAPSLLVAFVIKVVGYGTMGGYVYSDYRPSHGFQFIPIGVSYGRAFYAFAEFGMGWMYCPARAGIGIRF